MEVFWLWMKFSCGIELTLIRNFWRSVASRRKQAIPPFYFGQRHWRFYQSLRFAKRCILVNWDFLLEHSLVYCEAKMAADCLTSLVLKIKEISWRAGLLLSLCSYLLNATWLICFREGSTKYQKLYFGSVLVPHFGKTENFRMYNRVPTQKKTLCDSMSN